MSTTFAAPLLLLLASVPTLDYGVAEVHTGCVVAAPHEGFDSNTAPMARGIAEALGWGWTVADGFRQKSARRFINVNRPTERPWTGGGFGDEATTRRAAGVYAAYQSRLNRAAGRAPLDVLVEIHGHARRVEVDGERVKLQAIELATRGWSPYQLRKLRRRYDDLQEDLEPGDRVVLAIEQLDSVYEYRGVKIEFYFGASGSKRAGSLSEERTERALHFELPQKIRFDDRRRALYTKLIAALIEPLGTGG